MFICSVTGRMFLKLTFQDCFRCDISKLCLLDFRIHLTLLSSYFSNGSLYYFVQCNMIDILSCHSYSMGYEDTRVQTTKRIVKIVFISTQLSWKAFGILPKKYFIQRIYACFVMRLFLVIRFYFHTNLVTWVAQPDMFMGFDSILNRFKVGRYLRPLIRLKV